MKKENGKQICKMKIFAQCLLQRHCVSVCVWASKVNGIEPDNSSVAKNKHDETNNK